jgi:asparagine synthase (glutamine-hydrolysing)
MAEDAAPALAAMGGMSTLVGAVCSTREARTRLLTRLARGTRQLVLFDLSNGSAAAGECGFLCGPVLHAAAPGVGGEAAGLVALEGHLRDAATAACFEGAAAAARLAAAYRRGGAGAFADFGGNFSGVLLDAPRQLWLVRDAAGCKPLFTAAADDACVFASSALEAARVAHGRVTLSRAGLEGFLRTGRADAAGATPLRGVAAVPAGHAVAVGPRGATQSLAQRAVPEPRARLGLCDAAPVLWSRLCAIAAAQGDPHSVASALSGGLDSSSLLAARGTGEGPARAYSFCHGHAGLPAAWNERAFAEQATAHCGADTRYVGLPASELPALLAASCRAQDFPFGSPVVLAQAHLFRRAADEGVTRLLSGHGPDTLFGGGTSHLISRAADLLACGRALAAVRLLAGGRDYADVPLLRLAASTLALLARAPRGGSRLQRELETQLYRTIVPVSLSSEECSARACGIDNRQPYLERGVLTLAASLAPQAVLPGDGETKAVLRRAAGGHVPAAILARRRAIGFAVPVLPWLLELEPWVEAQWTGMAPLPGIADPPFAEMGARLRRGGGAAWGAAFSIWRRLILAAWIESHDVQLEAAA